MCTAHPRKSSVFPDSSRALCQCTLLFAHSFNSLWETKASSLCLVRFLLTPWATRVRLTADIISYIDRSLSKSSFGLQRHSSQKTTTLYQACVLLHTLNDVRLIWDNIHNKFAMPRWLIDLCITGAHTHTCYTDLTLNPLNISSSLSSQDQILYKYIHTMIGIVP